MFLFCTHQRQVTSLPELLIGIKDGVNWWILPRPTQWPGVGGVALLCQCDHQGGEPRHFGQAVCKQSWHCPIPAVVMWAPGCYCREAFGLWGHTNVSPNLGSPLEAG